MRPNLAAATTGERRLTEACTARRALDAPLAREVFPLEASEEAVSGAPRSARGKSRSEGEIVGMLARPARSPGQYRRAASMTGSA